MTVEKLLWTALDDMDELALRRHVVAYLTERRRPDLYSDEVIERAWMASHADETDLGPYRNGLLVAAGLWPEEDVSKGGHTDRDFAELLTAGVDPAETQPREQPVPCTICAEPTFNQAAGCDMHYERPWRARSHAEQRLG